MDFDSYGNSAPGIHRIEYSELETEFVANFPESLTRRRNLEGLLNYLKMPFFVNHKQAFTRLWIDGSFTTSKQNPNDIDGIIFINPNELGLEETKVLIDQFYDTIKSHGSLFKSDLYMAIDIDVLVPPDSGDHFYQEYYQQIDFQFKYWMGQFCFDRNRKPKGVFELDYKREGFSC